MKVFTIIAFLSLALTNGFAQVQVLPVSAQDQLLGMSETDARAFIPHKTAKVLEDKQYPLIKETLQIENIDVLRLKGNRNWDNISTVYLFLDSSDRVCRIHMVYNNLTPEKRQKLAGDVKAHANAKEDLTDKKHTTFIGRTKAADYILTWAKDKNRPATYLLVTANDYKQRMLNYLVNGGSLPEDGIFTPAPSK